MGEGSHRHILVVEDEPVISSLLGDVLRGAGYRVTLCATVAAGIAAASAHRDFALCISDFLLPDRTGLDFAREVRGLQPGLRIILASAFLESELEEKVAREPSIARIVRKPLDIFELRSMVDEMLREPTAADARQSEAC